jgi:hypothetical protein
MDRCYDHNFLQFSTILGEKIGVFLNVMITIFVKTSSSLSKKSKIFAKFFLRKY